MRKPEQPTSQPEAKVCLPTFIGDEFISGTLAPLLERDPARVAIVVSDHGSADGTTNLIQRVGGSRVLLVEGALGREARVGSD